MADVPHRNVWVHRHVLVGDSQIEGKGLFAAKALPAGVVVIRLAGRLVSSDELTELIERSHADPSAPYVDTLTIYEDTHLVLPGSSKVHFDAITAATRICGTLVPSKSPPAEPSRSARSSRSTTARNREPAGSA